MARRLLGATCVVLIVIGLVALADAQRGPSAAIVLSDARAFVQAHRSVRFAGSLMIEQDQHVTTARVAGLVERRSRSKSMFSFDDGRVIESIEAGAFVYVRSAPSAAAFTATNYSRRERSSNPGSLAPTNYNIALLLDAARHPTRIGSGASTTTIRVDVGTTELRAVVRDGGAVQSVVATARTKQGTITARLEYSGWGDAITIAAPSAAQLDRPGIEVAAIAAWHDSPLVMPRSLPAGWVLRAADVLPADETEEGCEQVVLNYANPANVAANYMVLYELPTPCAQRSPATRHSRFEITVGATVLRAESSLGPDALARVLADLSPLDLSA